MIQNDFVSFLVLLKLHIAIKTCFLLYLLCSVSALVAAQQIQNNSFEIPDTTRAQSKNWSTFNQGYIISIDSTVAHTGKHSAKIIKKGNAFYDGVTQTINYIPKQATRLILTGYVKTDGPNNYRAGLFIRVHNKDGTILILNTEDKEINEPNASGEWKKHSIEIYVPLNTTKIVAGGSLSANGIAWFDDLELQSVVIKDTAKADIAGKYLLEAYDIIRKNALRKDSVNLPAIFSEASKVAGPAKSPADCYDAVVFMLNGLGDHHSSLWTPEEYNSFKNNKNPGSGNIAWPSATLLNDSIGYIIIPYLRSNNDTITHLYADTLHQQIRKIDSSKKIIGWVVDLRKNLGGSWLNMVAAIGPILGEGIAGYTVDQYGKKKSWGYRNHCGFERDTCEVFVNRSYDLKNIHPRVAIITSNSTTSAGEVITIAFKSRNNTKSFGQATYGVATNKLIYPLSDGACITLAVAGFADRTGFVYPNKIVPDIIVEDDPSTKQDEIIMAALNWITRISF